MSRTQHKTNPVVKMKRDSGTRFTHTGHLYGSEDNAHVFKGEEYASIPSVIEYLLDQMNNKGATHVNIETYEDDCMSVGKFVEYIETDNELAQRIKSRVNRHEQSIDRYNSYIEKEQRVIRDLTLQMLSLNESDNNNIPGSISS